MFCLFSRVGFVNGMVVLRKEKFVDWWVWMVRRVW